MDRGTLCMMVSMIVSALACVFVLARLATRWFLVKKVGADDWLMLAAMCFSFGLTATIAIRKKLPPLITATCLTDRPSEAQNGLGEHVWLLQPAEIVQLMKVSRR
jgi:hypothetical protein